MLPYDFEGARSWQWPSLSDDDACATLLAAIFDILKARPGIGPRAGFRFVNGVQSVTCGIVLCLAFVQSVCTSGTGISLRFVGVWYASRPSDHVTMDCKTKSEATILELQYNARTNTIQYNAATFLLRSSHIKLQHGLA